MFFLQKKLWIAWRKVRFLIMPRERRVRLEVTTDGRHLAFLLTALGEAGYGVHVVGAPFVFRELMCLRKSVPIPFVFGGKERDCGIWISDRPSTLDSGLSKLFLLDYDYFSGLTTKHTNTHEREEAGLRLAGQAGAAFSNPFPSGLARDSESTSLIRCADAPASSPATSHPLFATAPEVPILDSRPSSLVSSSQSLRMPYFMHPSVYHKGLHKSRERGAGSLERGALDPRPSTPDSAAKQRRRFRVGFFGTHDREFYSKHYHFPGMNRFEILEVFFQKFGDRITHLQGGPRDWEPCEIAVSIDDRGGDRKGKSFLSQDHYFEALRECDFVLSPPGWCMPVSHNLIEAMFCGAVPITNGGAFIAETLKDGETCLDFQDAEGLRSVIKRALAMDERNVARMQGAVRDYYNRFLDPKAFREALVRSESGRVLVNAEENSVRLVFPGMVFPWEVPAKAVQT